jgi:hypothetical protein
MANSIILHHQLPQLHQTIISRAHQQMTLALSWIPPAQPAKQYKQTNQSTNHIKHEQPMYQQAKSTE